MQAVWKDTVIAESDETLMIEGSHYFPQTSLKKQYINASKTRTMHDVLGEASCFSIEIGGDINTDAVCYYAAPAEDMIQKVGHDFTGYVTFNDSVTVTG